MNPPAIAGATDFYFAAARFALTVRRDFWRAAALRCRTPFCTALSISETVFGSSAPTCLASLPFRALRRFLIEVRNFVRLERLIRRRRSLCRTRFSADLWLGIQNSPLILDSIDCG